jgi:hypothetical protein
VYDIKVVFSPERRWSAALPVNSFFICLRKRFRFHADLAALRRADHGRRRAAVLQRRLYVFLPKNLSFGDVCRRSAAQPNTEKTKTQRDPAALFAYCAYSAYSAS